MESALRELVRQTYSVCVNCGSEQDLQVVLIVPRDAGGKEVPSNATVLCRGCAWARERYQKTSDAKVPLNIWATNRFVAEIRKVPGTMSALIRFLVESYVEDPDSHGDIEVYQDGPTQEGVQKINFWLDRDLYRKFKEVTQDRHLTVTAAVKALVLRHLSK